MSDPAGVPPDAAEIARRFDAAGGFTVGLEEEVMILDPETLDLAPRIDELLQRVAGDPRFRPELPAAQVEIVTGPHARVGDAIAELAAARADLAAAAGDSLALAACGYHPFADPLGQLRPGPRTSTLEDRYASVARRQTVAALQIHVAVGGAERSLAVYNHLRCHLPALLALAANAPYLGGIDSGLATVRPTVAIQLPRQGIPPALDDVEQLARELAWGRRAGVLDIPGRWWWELRPHVAHGTLEVRVCDAQTTVEDAGALAAWVQALCAHLAELHDAGVAPPHPSHWRIAENRWSAIRHGVEGELADLDTGEPRATRERLRELRAAIAGPAERLGAADWLAHAERLIEVNGALRQRALAASGSLRELVGGLRDGFVPAPAAA
jgi:glutamate---cysteine ligase / carboxylate-amine ligase